MCSGLGTDRALRGIATLSLQLAVPHAEDQKGGLCCHSHSLRPLHQARRSHGVGLGQQNDRLHDAIHDLHVATLRVCSPHTCGVDCRSKRHDSGAASTPTTLGPVLDFRANNYSCKFDVFDAFSVSSLDSSRRRALQRTLRLTEQRRSVETML